MHFTVEGQPQGKARARFGNGHAYTPQKTKDYEERVGWAAKQVCRGLIQGPVRVIIVAYFQVPKKFKNKTPFPKPLTKPDLDNIAKSCLDSCNGILWKDDAQVVSLLITKEYSEFPRVEVDVLAI